MYGTAIPQMVPMRAPAKTSEKKWFPLAMRKAPVSVAIPKEAPATAYFHFESGKHWQKTIVVKAAPEKARVVCPDGNEQFQSPSSTFF